MIGTDPAETADALDQKAEFAAAELMRDLDSRLTQTEAENSRLREALAQAGAEHQPESPAVARRTVEFFLQTQQTDGPWESSGFMDDRKRAEQRLATRRKNMPDLEHRLVRRTTTVAVEVLDDTADRAEGGTPQ
jgi:hypothetical protein